MHTYNIIGLQLCIYQISVLYNSMSLLTPPSPPPPLSPPPSPPPRLYDRMSDLLEANVALASMGELLTEVFTGGPEICLKVREEQVERIFNIIKTENEGRAELLFTLQAMAKVSSLPPSLPPSLPHPLVINYNYRNAKAIITFDPSLTFDPRWRT